MYIETNTSIVAHYRRKDTRDIPFFFAAQEIMNGKTKCVGMCVYGDGRKIIQNNTVIPKASYFICMQQYRLPHL